MPLTSVGEISCLGIFEKFLDWVPAGIISPLNNAFHSVRPLNCITKFSSLIQ